MRENQQQKRNAERAKAVACVRGEGGGRCMRIERESLCRPGRPYSWVARAK